MSHTSQAGPSAADEFELEDSVDVSSLMPMMIRLKSGCLTGEYTLKISTIHVSQHSHPLDAMHLPEPGLAKHGALKRE